MSGIIGVCRIDGNIVDRIELQQMIASMADALAHRGPDGSGTWHHGPVGLGHRMLWTTPESLHEQLPLTDGPFTITADARIDNRDELITALDLTATPPEQLTDSALILHAYERWGESCVDHLLGDFAFAIWDDSRQHLFCARDHMGVKPFYYYSSDTLFAFASEIKALFCLPEVPREVNEVAIAYYLASIYDNHTITSYKHVLRLPSAHTLTLTHNEARLHQYWALDPTREIHFDTDEEYERAFRDLFTEAVRCRLRSAFPVGSELSGGLDSSSVTCVARDILRHDDPDVTAPPLPLHTFSAVFDELPECDERPYINAVLAQGDLQPHYVHPDQLSPLADIERVLWHEEELLGPNMYFIWAIFNAVQNTGARVLLDGEDGDTVISHGSGYFVELARSRNLRTLGKEMRALSERKEIPFYAVVWNPLILRLLPKSIRKRWWRFRKRGFFYDVSFIRPIVVQRTRVTERMRFFEDEQATYRTAREKHCECLSLGSVSVSLELLDKAASCFSFELRHPFYDKRLVEFCLALPTGQKLRDGLSRSIMRRALAQNLPSAVRLRVTKGDIEPNFIRNLIRFEQKSLEELLFNQSEPIEALVDIDRLREAYKLAIAGDGDPVDILWKATLLRLWFNNQDTAQQVHTNDTQSARNDGGVRSTQQSNT